MKEIDEIIKEARQEFKIALIGFSVILFIILIGLGISVFLPIPDISQILFIKQGLILSILLISVMIFLALMVNLYYTKYLLLRLKKIIKEKT